MKEINNLKIAIIHDFLTKIGGAEKVLIKIHDIFPDAPIYTLLYDEKGTKGLFNGKNFRIIPSGLQRLPYSIRRRTKLMLSKYPQAIEEFDLSEFDVVISSSNSFAHGVITKPKTFHISYCYSPMRYVWDWHHEYLDENNIGTGLIGITIRKLLSKIRIWDRAAADRVDQWVAISKTVQKRISKYYRKDSKVVYSPCDVHLIQMSDRKPENFYLIVSRLSPYKKIDLAIEAFNKFGEKLVIVGEGSDMKRLKSMASPNISFLGWQSDQKVHQLYSQAKALIFPGEEDLGLTPVESMAAGRPVIAYKMGGATETVIEGKTGIFFEEPTAESLIDAVNRFELAIGSFKPQVLRAQAEKFSTERFKKEFEGIVLDGYDDYVSRMNTL